jgi:acyl-CoA reductase-like NAD-dependent aldehyde dehydrogenase
VRKKEPRLAVQKTYKLFIGGKFVRGENGRVLPARDPKGKILANCCRASRKDFRDAVKAARGALGEWSKQSAYLRGQILYRAAELLEMRQGELEEELSRANGRREKIAHREIISTIDRLVHYGVGPTNLASSSGR